MQIFHPVYIILYNAWLDFDQSLHVHNNECKKIKLFKSKHIYGKLIQHLIHSKEIRLKNIYSDNY